jgi:gliding motility-associated-like protein
LKKFLIVISLFFSLKNYASHIVGGEMIYDYLGGNNYRITLKVYRDCSSATLFDPSALITVIETNDIANNNRRLYDIGSPVTIRRIPPIINNPCVTPNSDVCVDEGIYTYTLNLPAIVGGYYIVYQRCCRNNGIDNLLIPEDQGSTYYTKIPGSEDAVINSSPRFKDFPPIFLCSNLDFAFDHSAIDPDGDQLVYSLCPPFLGLDQCCPGMALPNPINCLNPPSSCPQFASPPPYLNVNFVSPYNGSYPIASNPSVNVNYLSGLLIGKPNLVGRFVVGVCVQEFRNGQLLGTHYRDFQFNIVPCEVTVISAIASDIHQCTGNAITFTNQTITNQGNIPYFWDFGEPTLTNDTSNLFSPTYTYQDTGKYIVTLIANRGKPCSDTVKKEVYAYPTLIVNFDKPQKQCFKNNLFSFEVKGDYLPGFVKFNWDFTAAATPSNSTLKNVSGVVFKQSGLFFVKLLATQFACRDSLIDTVRVVKPPQAKINNLPSGACNPAIIGFSNGSTSDLPLTYYWRFSNGRTSQEYEPIIRFSPAGIYSATLMAITSGLCVDTSMTSIKNLTVLPNPTASFNVSPKETSIFEPEIMVSNTASADVISWEYLFDDNVRSTLSDDKHVYQDYGNYLISQIVTNSFGCRDTARNSVKILPEFRFWVPNTFTPDGNALNDVFAPVTIGVYNYELEIYDRWGEKIFTSNNVNKGWNGFYKGNLCKQDIYAWRILFKNVVDQRLEEYHGHVLLLRNDL